MKLAGLRFRPRAWAFALALAGCAAGILLGNWQAGRAAEKRAAQASLKRVALSGEFLPDYTVLLDLRMHRGRAGYHVAQPLRLASGKEHAIVLRGWVEADPRRERLPDVITPRGEQRVEGVALEKLPRFLQQGKEHPCHPGPKPCVRLNLLPEEFTAWGLTVQQAVIEQTNELGDGLVRDWERPESSFLKNEMYALQWYSLSALSAVLFVALSFRRVSP